MCRVNELPSDGQKRQQTIEFVSVECLSACRGMCTKLWKNGERTAVLACSCTETNLGGDVDLAKGRSSRVASMGSAIVKQLTMHGRGLGRLNDFELYLCFGFVENQGIQG